MKSFWETIKPLIENQKRLVRDRESDIHWFEVVTSSVEFEISILTDNDLLNFALNSQSSYGLLFEQIRQFYFRFRGPSGLYKNKPGTMEKPKNSSKLRHSINRICYLRIYNPFAQCYPKRKQFHGLKNLEDHPKKGIKS